MKSTQRIQHSLGTGCIHHLWPRESFGRTIGVGAAEVAVGLALVIAVYRHFKTVDLEQLDTLKEE